MNRQATRAPMDTKEILKFVFVFASLPWVLPFVRSLLTDLLHAFDEDGGLLGEPPTEEELQRIQARKRDGANPLVSEPLAHVRAAVEAGERIPGQSTEPGSGQAPGR